MDERLLEKNVKHSAFQNPKYYTTIGNYMVED
jgi:hypothetical protein